MQEIVSFLVQRPEVLEQVIDGKASLLGVDEDEILSLIEGIKELGKFGGRPTYWFPED
ncbi:competence pheromone ComX [Bacillus sp. WMMC1349]|uniref:competence pheromone ComX n=1 Tax=Bacillus sp. WMMC1349 TaxID=2736254 RepID=UPI001553599F|nr:competence pheromone ComX [Bacillus sp. WMMC1349]NPC93979.1 competence pheromone ComX [Bacillus sp. WMMC1349]